MSYKNIHIRRFIIIYFICFGLLGSLLITLFAYFFGLISIQENYSMNYVTATFESFDEDMTALVKRNNTILFNISSNDKLRDTLLNTHTDIEERKIMVQTLLEETLAGYAEIKQIDIIFPTEERYTFINTDDETVPSLPLPSDEFISNLSERTLNLYEYCIFDQKNSGTLVFGRRTAIGSVILYMDETAIRNLYEAISLENSIIFLHNDNRIISCSDIKYIGLPSSIIFMENQLLSSAKAHPVFTNPLEISALGEDLELTYILSNEDMYQTTGALNRILVISLFVVVFACLIVVLIVSQKLINSIYILRKNLVLFSEDYTHNFTIAKDSELEALERQFIAMSERIRSLVHNIEKEKEHRRIAELKALQSQINPHFIYNSIDAISWMAKLEKPYKDIEKISYHLGRFFRLGLHKGEHMITIGDELHHVMSYIEIEKIRFPELFDVEVQVDTDMMDYKIIKIILQPIVENAINHGFKGISYKGLILIRILTDKENSELLIFQMIDNGKGMEYTGPDLPKSKNGSYGLVNVNERLVIEYGADAGLCFTSQPGRGTTVSFRIKKDLIRNC